MVSTTRATTIGGAGASWGFACGRIATWEQDLSQRPFFQALLRSGTLEQCRQEMAKSPAYRGLASDAASGPLAGAVKAFFSRRRDDLLSGCPDHALKDYIRFPASYRAFRSDFSRSAEGEAKDALAMEACLGRLMPERDYVSRLTEHRAMIHRAESPQHGSAPERSLYLDSLACSVLDCLARDAREPDVKAFFRDRAALAAWAAILRARRNHAPADRLHRWFVFRTGRELTDAMLAGESRPVDAIRPFIGADSWRALAGLPPERIREDADAAAAEALRVPIMACRRTTAGPERVLAYLEALAVEETNLALCLAAVSGHMDRAAAERRLRREYA